MDLTERNVKTGMIPNTYIREQLVREHLQQRQREAEQERMLVGLPRHWRLRHLVGRLVVYFVALGTRMQRRGRIDRPIKGNGARIDAPLWRGREHKATDPS